MTFQKVPWSLKREKADGELGTQKQERASEGLKQGLRACTGLKGEIPVSTLFPEKERLGFLKEVLCRNKDFIFDAKVSVLIWKYLLCTLLRKKSNRQNNIQYATFWLSKGGKNKIRNIFAYISLK